MARILITALGAPRLKTGGYKNSEYAFMHEGKYQKTYGEMPFIARAICLHYDVQRVLIVGTRRSMWDALYKGFGMEQSCSDSENAAGDWSYSEQTYAKINRAVQNPGAGPEEDISLYLEDLNGALDHGAGGSGSRCFIVKYGLDEDELAYNFEVFNQIAECIGEDDEIILDITHSFRSLALFQYVMINYLSNVRKIPIRVSHVLYGMLEASDEYQGKVPVVDLRRIFELSEWMKGYHELETFGSGYLLADLIERQDKPEEGGVPLKDMADDIRNLSNALNINYLPAIREQHGRILQSQWPALAGPGAMVSGRIEEHINSFGQGSREDEFQIRIAEWCFDNRRYAAGYITLHEGLITGLCLIFGLDHLIKCKRSLSWDKCLKPYMNHPDESLKRAAEEIDGLRTDLARIRNNIAHARENGRQPDQPVNKCLIYVNRVRQALLDFETGIIAAKAQEWWQTVPPDSNKKKGKDPGEAMSSACLD